MKTLRFLGMALFAVLMCVNFASCNNEESNAIQDGEKVLVSLGFGGDYEISESPLSREADENPDLYFISVTDANGLYARGLFDNLDDINIELTKNVSYTFSVVIVKDGKSKLSQTDNIFTTPLFKHQLTNEFSKENLSGDGSKSFTLADGNEYYIANIEMFQNLMFAYIPKNDNDISIPVYRFYAFGAEFKANYFDEGTLKITLENSETVKSPMLSIIHPESTISEIFTVADTDLWKSSGEYSVLEAKVNITWVKSDNSEVSLGSSTALSFKQGYKTTIKINVDKSTNNAISFDINETELGDGGTYIVENGQAKVEE